MLKNLYAVFIAGILVVSCSVFPGITTGSVGNIGDDYEMITASEMREIQKTEEITLINVHIPWEGNIPETDLEIPFDAIEEYTDVLPQDKDEKFSFIAGRIVWVMKPLNRWSRWVIQMFPI